MAIYLKFDYDLFQDYQLGVLRMANKEQKKSKEAKKPKKDKKDKK